MFLSILESGRQEYYTVGYYTGVPEMWETNEQRFIRQSYAMPGKSNPAVDFIISDRSEDDMAILEWRAHGVEHSVKFHFPPLDVVDN